MSKIKVLFGFMLALAISACTDFVDPAIPYSDFNTGVYLRTLSVTSSFNFFQLSTSKFSLMVEAVDIEDGKTVDKVDVLVRRRRGQALTPEVQVKSVPASEFKPHTIIDPLVHESTGSPYPAATIEITVPEALQAMNLTAADVTGGDFFEFRLILTDKQGRTFTNSNLSPDLSGGQYYSSPFFYRIPVVCPSTLAGTYNLTTVGWCGDTYTGKVKFVVDPAVNTSYILEVDLGGTFVQDFSLGAYEACYGVGQTPPGGANGLRVTDACGQIGFTNVGSSPFGDLFSVVDITVAGPVLTFKFETNWDTGGGVLEGGTATITRTDGTNWPPLRR
jgi:hypothetical protein